MNRVHPVGSRGFLSTTRTNLYQRVFVQVSNAPLPGGKMARVS